MKLKTSLQISAVFPVLLAIIVSVGLMARATLIRGAKSRGKVGEEAVTRIIELERTAYSSLISGDTSAVKEWEKSNRKLEKFLTGQTARDVVEEIALENIAENVAAMRKTFLELSSLRTLHGADVARKSAVSKKYLDLESEMARQVSIMLKGSFTLTHTGERNALVFEDATDRMFLVFIGVCAMIMTAAILGASKSAVRRLMSLKDVSHRVAKGDFQLRLDAGGADEVSESFRAFNTVLANLGKMRSEKDSSTSALSHDAEDSKRAAEAAREGNIRLADALTKLQRAQKQIIEQERFKALEQIGLGITRDFSTVITPILSTSELLLDSPQHLDNKEELAASLRTINDAAKDARKKIRRLSDLIQPHHEKREKQAVDINVIVEKAVEMTEPRWKTDATEKGLSISCTVSAGAIIPLVEGNEDELLEAVIFLVSNAVEAMPKGGNIKVETLPEGDRVILKVADDGEGMTEEVHGRCLEPFFSTKGSDHSGMGLTAVQATATSYGGSVVVDSVEGEGTTVVVSLVQQKKDAKTAVVAPEPQISGKLNILVIDDEGWVRNVLSRGFSRDGHIVEVAQNGNEGLGKCHSGKYDIVILDRAMPDMTGDDVAAIIRHNHPDLPVMMLTGFGELMNKKHTLPKGVDFVLGKPVTMDELREAVAHTIHLRKRSNS